MGDLLAKVKRKNNLVRVLSDVELFDAPQALANSIAYSPHTLIEEDEWYKVENVSQQDFSIAFIQAPYIAVDHNQIAVNDYKKVDYLCSLQGHLFFFQKVVTSQILKKRLLWISPEPEILTNPPVIILNSYADGIYDGATDTLHFQKLIAIKSIFKGIDELYRQATLPETEAFLQNDFLNIHDDFSAVSVSIPNRRRIALVTDTLNNFSKEQKDNICEYIQQYCQNIPFDNGTFDITSDNDLKLVIYGIEQRFYTTIHGNEKRIANSIIHLP